MSSGANFPMLDLYQQEAATHAGVLESGLKAIEAGEEPPAVSAEALLRAAHSIKGAAKIVGIGPVGELAGALEHLFQEIGDAYVTVLAGHYTLLKESVEICQASGRQEADAMSAWLEGVAKPVKTLVGRLQALAAEDRPTAGEAPAGPAPAQPAEAASLADSSMLDLFRTEASEQLQKLSSGLVQLEADPADTSRIEPLMRAAHSMKGAARIVGLKSAVDLAHEMENALVAAQEGKILLNSDSIDVLLEATDYLNTMSLASEAQLASWSESHPEEMASFQKQLAAIQSDAFAVQPKTPEPPTTAPASGEAPPPAPPPALKQPKAEPKGKGEPDSVVRVSAENLNRLMGLAAETLVETRKLTPFRDTLLKLKETQVELNHRLDRAQQTLQDIRLEPSVEAEMELVGNAARQSLEAIRKQIDFFDGFSRSHTLLSDRLYREVLDSRMRPFNDGVIGYPRLVRDIARALGKKVAFSIEGHDTPVDRDMLEKLDAPLNHILRNACDHGLETPEERQAAGKPEGGNLKLSARHSAGMLVVEVRDDGRGIDVEKIRAKVIERSLCTAEMAEHLSEDEVLEFLFLPGFSTAQQVTEISGRGVGLDVVQSLMQEIGGQVRVQTAVGQGSVFTIEVPITRSVVRALIVELEGEPYAFPLNRIARTLQLAAVDLRVVENRQYFDLDGVNVGLVSGHAALGMIGAVSTLAQEMTIVVVNDRNNLYGVEVDKLIGESDLVVRPLDQRLGKVPGIGAASITEEGEPLLIIDTEDLVQSIDKLLSGGSLVRADRREAQSNDRRKRILVVDDSITVRATEQQLLEKAGYEVELAVDGADGWNAVRLGEFDLVVTDVDMPRLNGFELVSRIRGDNRLARLPIVIVSYKDREEDRMRGLDAGADFYLTKSAFQDDTFIEAITDLIGGPT